MYKPIPDMVILKELLERHKCHVHGENPKIYVLHSTMLIICCCYRFHEECCIRAAAIDEGLEIDKLSIK